MRTLVLTVLLALVSVTTAGCLSISSVYANKETSEAAYQRGDEVIAGVEQALASTGKSARIYIQQGNCHVGYLGYLLFPEVKPRIPAAGQKGLEAIRYMFGADPDVTVMEDLSGIVRIKIGNVSSELMDTRVGSVSFSEFAQYNPWLPDGAIDTILATPEARATMYKLHVSRIGGAFEGLTAPPIETTPHLPPSLGDMTVDQAFDAVANTFGGIVTYEECRKPNGYGLIDVGFSRIPKDGD